MKGEKKKFICNLSFIFPGLVGWSEWVRELEHACSELQYSAGDKVSLDLFFIFCSWTWFDLIWSTWLDLLLARSLFRVEEFYFYFYFHDLLFYQFNSILEELLFFLQLLGTFYILFTAIWAQNSSCLFLWTSAWKAKAKIEHCLGRELFIISCHIHIHIHIGTWIGLHCIVFLFIHLLHFIQSISK